MAARDDGLEPPIFLIGNVRSGTSMMHDLFDAHPDLKSWYEPRTVWVYADPARRHDRFDASDATPRVRRYIRGRFRAFQRRHEERRIMEKTPSNVMRIPYVHAIFPESKLLYIVREPLASLSSQEIRWRETIHMAHLWDRLKEVPKTQMHYYVGRLVRDKLRVAVLRKRHVSLWGVRYPGVYDDIPNCTTEEIIARQWVACCRQARADLDGIDPGLVLRIRYEDFVAAPVEHFERIAAHFDLPLTDALVDTIRDTVDPGRQQKWRRLSDDVLRRCLPILKDEMAAHGYEIPDDVAHLIPGRDGGASESVAPGSPGDAASPAR